MSRILLSSVRFSYLRLSYASTYLNNNAVSRSTVPCASCQFSKRGYASVAAQPMKDEEITDSRKRISQERTLDEIEDRINKLDQHVKRVGRTNRKDVERAINAIKKAGSVSVTQSLMILRSCGSLLVEEQPNVRNDLVHQIWNMLEDLDVKLDISHYNALIRVYLENEFTFNPSDILKAIEGRGLQPNRVTCQRLIHRYCQVGDIAGATRVLQFMRDQSMPINESVFNALISGHSEVNDMESAEGILSVMKESGLEPSSETYTILICGFIKNGDLAKVEEVLKKCESNEIIFSDRDYFDMIYAYATKGYDGEIDKVISKIRKHSGYNQDAMNFAFKLLAIDKCDVAYKILKTITRQSRPDGTFYDVGNFFLAHIVRNDKPIDVILKYCEDLVQDNLNPNSFVSALEQAIRYAKPAVAIALLKDAQKNDRIPIRQHYFWPILAHYGKEGNIDEMGRVLMSMIQDFNISPSKETIQNYVAPFMLKENGDIGSILATLKSYGIPPSTAAGSIVTHLLVIGKMEDAANIVKEFTVSYAPNLLRRGLIHSLLKTRDVTSFITILKDLSRYMYAEGKRQLEYENDERTIDHREFVGEIIGHAVERLIADGKTDLVEELIQKLADSNLGVSEGRVQFIQILVKDILPPELVNSLAKLSSDEFAVPETPEKGRVRLNTLDDEGMKRVYELTKSRGEVPGVSVLRSVFRVYLAEGDEEKVEQIRKDLEDMNYAPDVGMIVIDLTAYLEKDEVEKAWQIYQKLSSADPNFRLNPQKTLKLVDCLVSNERYEDGLEVLKRYKTVPFVDPIVPRNSLSLAAYKILIRLANKGEVEKAKEFFDSLISAEFGEGNKLRGPIIDAYITRGDIDGALKEFENCANMYKVVPRKRRLMKHFIEKEDAANLQNVVDITSQVHGESNALVDLMFAFLETGRLNQAQRIFESPGFRLTTQRLQFICESLRENSGKILTDLLKVTRHLPIIDRGIIYDALLSVYEKHNDPSNSLSLWIEIQEEGLQPSDKFLVSLARQLKKNHMEVPFVVPEPRKSKADYSSELLDYSSEELRKLIDGGNLEAAVALVQSTANCNVKDCWDVITALLRADRYDEAKKLLIESNSVVIHSDRKFLRPLKYLMRRAVGNKDVDFFLQMEKKLPPVMKIRGSFSRFKTLAYLQSGRIDELLSSWEAKLEEMQSKEQLNDFFSECTISNLKVVMREVPELIPRIEAIAKKCIELGDDVRMPLLLFWHSFVQKDNEKASQIWNEYLKDIHVARVIPFVLRQKKEDQSPELSLRLLSFIEDKASGNDEAVGSIYSHLIHMLVRQGEIEKAKEYAEEALTKVPIEQLALRSLKMACLSRNIDFPHQIREENRNRKNEGSDSDSD